MQQIKNDPVPLHGSVMNDGMWGNGATHTGRVVSRIKKNKTKPINTPVVPSKSRFSMRHLPLSIINTQFEPGVISPYRFYIEHNEAAITQKLAAAIKSFRPDQSSSDVNHSSSFPNGERRTLPGTSPEIISAGLKT